MIERIHGRLLQKSPTFCVIDCGGIGIGVFISINTFQSLGKENQPVDLLTHLHVREDALQLFGFRDEAEREIFKKLLGVSGIGPRLAITILSGITASELIQAVASEDYQLLTKIPGVGKKTAQRIVLELKEKVALPTEFDISTVTQVFSSISNDKLNEAIMALSTLGYSITEARSAVHKVVKQQNGELALEEIIKLALREI